MTVIDFVGGKVCLLSCSLNGQRPWRREEERRVSSSIFQPRRRVKVSRIWDKIKKDLLLFPAH